MSPDSDFASIADASRPNAGRIYDYLLGGNHNFEIDRQAAQQLLQLAPGTPQVVRLIRWFLGEAVRRLVEQGFSNFVDFASGLPTVDHVHQVAPKHSRVLYSDVDPVTVAYAQEIIRDVPEVAFLECDVRQPEKLLKSDTVQKLFSGERKLAIGMNGIAWFLTDEEIAHALETLYGWAGEGSKLYYSDADTHRITATTENLFDFYSKVGQPVYSRSLTRIKELLGKWKIEEPGFQPLTAWLEVGDTAALDEREKIVGGLFVGAILAK